MAQFVGFYSMAGGGVMGSNPFDLMELIRRAPQGSSFTYQSMFRLVWPISAMCIALGQHVRAGIEENLWGAAKGGPRYTSVEMIHKMVRMTEELGRPIATPEETKQILKLGTWYDTPDETLFNLGLPPNRDEGERGFPHLRHRRKTAASHRDSGGSAIRAVTPAVSASAYSTI